MNVRRISIIPLHDINHKTNMHSHTRRREPASLVLSEFYVQMHSALDPLKPIAHIKLHILLHSSSYAFFFAFVLALLHTNLTALELASSSSFSYSGFLVRCWFTPYHNSTLLLVVLLNLATILLGSIKEFRSC